MQRASREADGVGALAAFFLVVGGATDSVSGRSEPEMAGEVSNRIVRLGHYGASGHSVRCARVLRRVLDRAYSPSRKRLRHSSSTPARMWIAIGATEITRSTPMA